MDSFRSIILKKIQNINNKTFLSPDYVYNRYWNQGECEDYSKPSSDETTELQLDNVAGIFFVLLGGIFLSVLAWFIDRVYKAKIKVSSVYLNYFLFN